MCYLAAKVLNKSCHKLYERIIGIGIANKMALVAVMNKPLKQVFSTVKSGEVYCEKGNGCIKTSPIYLLLTSL
jgi:hypothetical protein